jgi:Zn-dependent peptidase ImmA (M78 family)
VAHEIGHFVKRATAPDAFEYVDRRDNLSATGTDPDEIYANEFAANLLMPEDWVRKYTENNRSPAELAIVFGVSAEAMNYRLQNLGLA